MKPRLLTAFGIVLTFVSIGMVMAQSTPEATETPEPPAPSLVGATWQWEHFTNAQQAMNVLTPNYTITFRDDGQLKIRADCNTILGTYSAENSRISITLGPTTLVGCPTGSLNADFLGYVSQVERYAFDDNSDLLLEIPAASGTLTFSAQPQITGTVTYRVRIALPADAIVRVQIQDISIADAPTTIIGEQVIVADGIQVPIPFAVAYPASAIQENRRYSLSARITDGEGNLLFISDTVVPVITEENPTSDIQIVLVQVHP